MIGNLLILVIFIITTVLFLLSKSLVETTPTFTLFAQYSALLASISISINYILAIRNKFIEKLFKGLDNVYRNHILLGNLGFIFAILHVFLLIISGLPFNFTSIYLIPSLSNLPYAFGILSFYSLIIFVSLTIFVKLPYKLWKNTHQFIILVVLFSFLHAFTINSDVARFMPLRLWILGFNIVAIVAYIYRRLLYHLFVPLHKFSVNKVEIDNDYILISLENKNKTNNLEIKDGQYVFISRENKTRDEHPFSVMKYTNNQILLGAKVVGEFTNKIKEFKKNEIINLYGPFGYFSEKLEKNKNIVFISAGIGITPFYSMVKNIGDYQKVTMIHSAKTTDPKIISNMFLKFKSNNFKFIEYFTDIEGRIGKNKLSKYINFSNKDNYYYICGPEGFMENVYKILVDNGVKNRHIKLENFSFK